MSSENTLFPLPDTLLRPMVEQALSEDLGRRGDITSAAVIAPDKTAKLFLVSREDGVIAGMDLAHLAFQTMDPSVRFQAENRDGQAVRAGQTLAAVEGNARALLAAIPEPAPGVSRPAEAIGGEIPSPAAPPPGCRFHTRCTYVQERCRVDVPELIDDAGDGHPVACHFWREIAARHPFAPPVERQGHGPAAERVALYRHAVARAEPIATTTTGK